MASKYGLLNKKLALYQSILKNMYQPMQACLTGVERNLQMFKFKFNCVFLFQCVGKFV